MTGGMHPPGASAVLSGLLIALAVSLARPARHRLRGSRPPALRRGRSGRAEPMPSARAVAVLARQLAALLHAGLAPGRVWRAVADRTADRAIRGVAAAVVAGGRRGERTGVTLRGYLEHGSGRGDDAALRRLAVAVDVSERTGAPLGPTLGRLAEALRDEELAAEERASALAGPRASATVLAVLPLAGVVLGGAVGSDPVHVLLGTAPGRVCLVLGGVLWAVGRAWTAALVRRAARG
jgi:tight adherence protein B